MDPQELVKVYSTTDPAEAEVIKVALEEDGIRCEIDGLLQAGFTGTLEIGLLVRAIDSDRARKIIQDHQHRHA